MLRLTRDDKSLLLVALADLIVDYEQRARQCRDLDRTGSAEAWEANAKEARALKQRIREAEESPNAA
jgi:hypothetical protein